MPPEDRDPAYIWDMLDASRTLREFMASTTLPGYLRDRKLQLAVERVLEIIGEACLRVSPATRSAHPEIPWHEIVGLRNFLAHQYGDIRQERVFQVATDDIPALIASLELLVPRSPEDPG